MTTPTRYGDLEVVAVDLSTRTAVFQIKSAGSPDGPEFRVALSMIRPSSEEDRSQFWRALVNEVMESLKQEGKLPKFVKNYSAFTGDDSSGEPAIYVKVFVDAPPGIANDATVVRWNEFTHLLQDRLLQLRLQRLPYVLVGAN